MVQKTYTHVPFKEVNKICFVCKECKTQFIVSVNGSEEKRKLVQQPHKPCSVCGQNFPESLSDAFTNFIYWYEKAHKSDHDIFFVMEVI